LRRRKSSVWGSVIVADLPSSVMVSVKEAGPAGALPVAGGGAPTGAISIFFTDTRPVVLFANF
jgi:hypothetical protein